MAYSILQHAMQLCAPDTTPDRAWLFAEIEQPKASQKDIGLAWERIETFLWKHVGPNSGAQSSSQGMSQMQNGDTVSSSQMPDNMAGSSQDTATNGFATA